MEKVVLEESQIDFILNDAFDQNFWFYQLGISISKSKNIYENRFSSDFYNLGKKQWESLYADLLNILCDRDKKTPRDTINDLLNGDIRNIVLYIFANLISEMSFVTGVAIPVTSLILKQGVIALCKNS
jgi:hypothetical protein